MAATHVHLCVSCVVVAEGCGSLFHGDEAPVGIFVCVAWFGAGVVFAEEERSRAGFDAVAADYCLGWLVFK